MLGAAALMLRRGLRSAPPSLRYAAALGGFLLLCAAAVGHCRLGGAAHAVSGTRLRPKRPLPLLPPTGAEGRNPPGCLRSALDGREPGRGAWAGHIGLAVGRGEVAHPAPRDTGPGPVAGGLRSDCLAASVALGLRGAVGVSGHRGRAAGGGAAAAGEPAARRRAAGGDGPATGRGAQGFAAGGPGGLRSDCRAGLAGHRPPHDPAAGRPLAGWSPQQLEMVLLHELAHVRRYDNLVNLLQRTFWSRCCSFSRWSGSSRLGAAASGSTVATRWWSPAPAAPAITPKRLALAEAFSASLGKSDRRPAFSRRPVFRRTAAGGPRSPHSQQGGAFDVACHIERLV